MELSEFEPKSTTRLLRGQYWAIPLPDGTFGAGCVVGHYVADGKRSTRTFIAGVVGWNGPLPPRTPDLAGCGVLDHGFAHIRVITRSGGRILGSADISLEALPTEAESASISTWGYGVPAILAAKYAAEAANNSFKPNPLRGST